MEEGNWFQNAIGATLRFLKQLGGSALNLINAVIGTVGGWFGYKAGESSSAVPAAISKPVEIKPTEKGTAILSEGSIDALYTQLQEGFKKDQGIRLEKTPDQQAIKIVIEKPEASKGTWLYTKSGTPDVFTFVSPDFPDAASTYRYSFLTSPETLRDAILAHAKAAHQIDIHPDVITKLQGAFAGRAGAQFIEADTEEKKRGHHYKLVIENNGQPEIWYMDKTRAEDEHIQRQACFRKKDNPDYAMHIPVSGVVGDVKLAVAMALSHRAPTLDKAEHILNIADEIRRDAISEKQDIANVKAFDLPKDRPIGYLGFNGMLSEKDAANFKKDVDLLYALPELMGKCGYRMVCANEKRVIELKDAPAATIDNNIKVLYDAGVRDFYLRFNLHGGPLGSSPTYESVTGKSSLSSDDMREIISKYKDCHFTIDSTACYGGGLIEMMRDFKDHSGAKEGRVNVFVHTKERLLNYEYYSGYLVDELKKMADKAPDAAKTYGEVHQRVDEAVKKQATPGGSMDPEYWKSMPDGESKRTAMLSPAFEDALKKAQSGYIPQAGEALPLAQALPKTEKPNRDSAPLV